MKLAFLGTGAAFSLERYNGAVVVDGRVLLDAGAPLLPHMHKLGLDPGAIEVVFLTHFHGDHLLGLASFLLHRIFVAPTPLLVVGPPGVDKKVEELGALAWGADWPQLRSQLQISYQNAVARGQAAGLTYESRTLDHGSEGGTGYRLHIGGRVLVYAGDSEMTPALDALVEGADIAIVEATGPGPVPSHTSWAEAAGLQARHPSTIFMFNHLYSGQLEGAARDLELVEI